MCDLICDVITCCVWSWSFWNGIHNLLRRADARGNADIIYHIWCISL